MSLESLGSPDATARTGETGAAQFVERLRRAASPLAVVAPLARVGLWGLAFAIAYHAQGLLADQRDYRDVIVYLAVACALMAVAAWPAGGAPSSLLWSPRRDGSLERLYLRVAPVAVPVMLLCVAIGAGMAFRLYDLGERPYGIWFDEAQNGLIARGILNGDNPRIFIGGATQLPSGFFYVYAFFVRIIGDGDVLALRSVSAIGGLLALPALFLLTRELYGWRAAALATLFLAVMRWHVNFSRFGVTNVWAAFFVIAAMFFFVRAVRGKGSWNAVVAGAFIGMTPYAGFYGIFVPILVGLFWAHSGLFERVLPWRQHAATLLIAGVVALAVYSPVLSWGLTHRDEFAERPGTASIINDKSASEAVDAVLKSAKQHVLMFHASGDRNGRHNLPGEPMLDATTGILFVLGIGIALSRLRRPAYFLPIAWLLVFIQNGIWSVDFEAPQAFRTSSLTPAVAMLAALPLAALWEIAARRSRPPEGAARATRWYAAGQSFALRGVATAVVVVAVVVATRANWQTYFDEQLRNPAVINAYNADVALAAEEMAALADEYELHVSALFFSPVTNYVFTQPRNMHRFDPSLDIPSRAEGNVAFVLDYTKEAHVSWLTYLYPDAELRQIASPVRGAPPLVHIVLIPADQVQAARGIEGTYTRDGEPPIQRREASLELDWNQSLPLAPPFDARWTGTLKVPAYQDLELTFMAPGHVRLSLGGEVIAEGNERATFYGRLARGNHQIVAEATIERPGNVALLAANDSPYPADMFFAGGTVGEPRGLRGTFYRGPDFSGAVALEQIDPFVGQLYHGDLPFLENFSVVWKGHITITEEAIYPFWIEAADEGWLLIDGEQHLAPGIPRADVPLTVGLHEVEVRFVNRRGYPGIFWYWQPPNTAHRIIVPAAALTPP